ncbi:MAG: hypothetical protein OQK64_02185, partial [Ignavibacteriaceae bacterium]|nr:hypothetical protein [Ignavibacteriaceae bacterium]
KKIVTLILINAILIQIVGCYSYQEITKEEFLNVKENEDLRVTTKNQTSYEFDAEDYIVKNDSIYGNGKIVNTKLKKRYYKDFEGSIYLGDVESLKFDSFDVISTVVVVAVTAGFIALVISGFSISFAGWGEKGGSGHGL